MDISYHQHQDQITKLKHWLILSLKNSGIPIPSNINSVSWNRVIQQGTYNLVQLRESIQKSFSLISHIRVAIIMNISFCILILKTKMIFLSHQHIQVLITEWKSMSFQRQTCYYNQWWLTWHQSMALCLTILKFKLISLLMLNSMDSLNINSKLAMKMFLQGIRVQAAIE